MPEADAVTAPVGPRPTSWAQYLWAALVLGAMTLVFFSPVFRYEGSFSAVYAHQRGTFPWVKAGDEPVFSLHDQADYVYPRQVFLDRSIKQEGDYPLWNPLAFAGHPFFAETGSRMAYPPFVVLTLLFSPVLMHDAYLLVHIFGAGMAMFALMKQFRAGFGGALLAGVAWAFSSYGLLYYALEMYPAVAAILPLVVLCVHRWHERKSWPPLLTGGLLLGLLYLGSSAELAFMSFLCAGAYAGCLALRDIARPREGIDLRRAARLLLAPAVLLTAGAAVAAVNIVPFVDLSARSGRMPVSYADIMKYFPHVALSDFARVFFPPAGPLDLRGVSQQVFLGTATALLAVVGLFGRRPGSALGRALLVVVFLFAIGGPGTWLAYHLPGINKLHGVGRSFFLFNFGLAVLAGLGLDRVVRWLRARPAALPAAGLAAVCVLTVYGQLFAYGRDINPSFQPRDPRFLLPPTPATEAARAVLASTPGGGRVLPVIRQGVEPAQGYVMPAATNMALGLPTTGGYEPVLPEHIATMWRVLTGEPLQRVMETKLHDTALHAQTVGGLARVDLFPRFGVSAVLGPPTMPDQVNWGREAAAARGLRLSYTGRDGVVYEVVDRNPRAFVVHEAEWTRSYDDALVRFESAAFDVRRQVLLDAGDAGHTGAGPARPPAPDDDVRWLDDDPDGVALGVDATRDGWLVLLDSWDPGWEVTVDGRDAPVLRANFGFRAVPVTAGTSTVRFSYRPAPVRAGAGISVLATVALLALAAGVPAYRRWGGRARELAGTETGGKLLRYSGASVVNVVVGEVVLAVAFGLLGWTARSASILAAVVAAGPAYVLARRWVWGRSGRSHLVKEVLPFWALALVGLALTTWAAGVGEGVGTDLGVSRFWHTGIVMASVLAVSALFWVVRFLLLNRVLFADRGPPAPAPPDAPAEAPEVSPTAR